VAQALAEADLSFVEEASRRLSDGAEKYGPAKFLEVDTLQEAMDEVLDLANYARMTYIKLFLLQESLKKIVSKHPAADAQGFVPMKEFMQ